MRDYLEVREAARQAEQVGQVLVGALFPAARPDELVSGRELAQSHPRLVSAAIRTKTGGLIAPVIWSDNWIEIVPGEKRELTALLPEDAADGPVVEVGSWNAGSQTIAIAVK